MSTGVAASYLIHINVLPSRMGIRHSPIYRRLMAKIMAKFTLIDAIR
jgi:hypothetical protein